MSLLVDIIFIVGYSLTLGLACLLTDETLRSRGWRSPPFGLLFAGGVTIAAALDVVEDLALLGILYKRGSGGLAQVARLCALLKFALVILCLLYVALSGVLGRRFMLGIGGMALAIILSINLVFVLSN